MTYRAACPVLSRALRERDTKRGAHSFSFGWGGLFSPFMP